MINDLTQDPNFKILYDLVKKKNRGRKNADNNMYGLPKLVFLCGKDIKDNDGNCKSIEELRRENNKRYEIISHLRKATHLREPGKVSTSVALPILSELLYQSNIKSFIDLLSFEETLFRLSDYVIILPESHGAICELGAFTVGDVDEKELARKLCIINDLKHKDNQSFISVGPIRKVDELNQNVFYINTEKGIFEQKNMFLDKYFERLIESPTKYLPNVDQDEIDVKNFIYEICAILEVFEPLGTDLIAYLYKDIKNFDHFVFEAPYKKQFPSLKQVLSFMVEIGLLKKTGNLFSLADDYNFSCADTLFSATAEEIMTFKDEFREVVQIHQQLEGGEGA